MGLEMWFKKFTILLLVLFQSFTSVFAQNCNALNPKQALYYYDAHDNSCVKFSMTHPLPKAIGTEKPNIFNDEKTCITKCQITPKPQCVPRSKLLTVTQQSATQTAFVNVQVKKTTKLILMKCVPRSPFTTYEAFPVNLNAFPSLASCEAACTKSPVCQFKNPTAKNGFYWDDPKKVCKAFSATVIQQSSSNYFTTKAECKTACIKTPKARCTPPTADQQVTKDSALVISDGTANSIHTYDQATFKCIAAQYGGYSIIPANTNFFTTKAECLTECERKARNAVRFAKLPLTSACRVTPPTSTAYYFDSTSCVAFVMNVPLNTATGNAFPTKKQCETECIPKPEDRCNPTSEVIRVNGASSKRSLYTFDAKTKTCKVFEYGGYITLPANSNLFTSLADCKKTCIPQALCDPSQLPTATTKYYFDNALKECIKIQLSVPVQPSSNVFTTEAKCKADCLPTPATECIPTKGSLKVTRDSVGKAYWVYESVQNRCHPHTYGGVIEVPTTSNFFAKKQTCVDKCVKTTIAPSTTLSTTTPLSTTVAVTTLAFGQTPPPTTPKPGYQDQFPQCCAWAKLNQCFTNGLWMKVSCPASCGTLGATPETAGSMTPKPPKKCHLPPAKLAGTDPGPCEDIVPECDAWGDLGECSGDNAVYMQPNCRKTCKSCGVKMDNFYPNCNKGSGTCVNLQQDGCCYWALQNQCLLNPNFMNVMCAAACNKCQAASANSVQQSVNVQVLSSGSGTFASGSSATQRQVFTAAQLLSLLGTG